MRNIRAMKTRTPPTISKLVDVIQNSRKEKDREDNIPEAPEMIPILAELILDVVVAVIPFVEELMSLVPEFEVPALVPVLEPLVGRDSWVDDVSVGRVSAS